MAQSFIQDSMSSLKKKKKNSLLFLAGGLGVVHLHSHFQVDLLGYRELLSPLYLYNLGNQKHLKLTYILAPIRDVALLISYHVGNNYVCCF